MRRKVSRGIVGLIRVAMLGIVNRFPGRGTLVHGHSKFGHVGRMLDEADLSLETELLRKSSLFTRSYEDPVAEISERRGLGWTK